MTLLMTAGLMTTSALGCGPPSSPFPPDVEPDAWIESRPPCTYSHDHDLTYIRVWTNAAAHEHYTTFEGAYPPGATLLKGMYRDEDCEELDGFVTMEKLDEGAAPENMDWEWHRFDETGSEIVNPRRIPSTCVDCHVWHCGELPYGWDLTCSQEGLQPPGPPPGS